MENEIEIKESIKKSLQMLLGGNSDVSELATACGFENTSSFLETFVKLVGKTPDQFKKEHKDTIIFPSYSFEDILFAAKIPAIKICEDIELVDNSDLSFINVHVPEEEYGYFLHEAAIIEYRGVLYASWYNCKEKELLGNTPIVGRRSFDGGKTWTDVEVIACDKTGKIMYCPPVYGVCDGKLYMLLNQMVAPDHIHSLDLYILNEKSDKFELVWSRPIPFKLNTNVVSLPNGKLILPGRVGELDAFPSTPAVLISDSGKIDGEWRLVKAAENDALLDGARLIHPETTLICCNDVLYMFCRDDLRQVPLVYISKDFGESWGGVNSHNILCIGSKIYSGQLSNGKYYFIANVGKWTRSKLVLFVSEKNKLNFNKQMVLLDCEDDSNNFTKCHYPAACEKDGKLYIIATVDYDKESFSADEATVRGAVLFTVDVSKFD